MECLRQRGEICFIQRIDDNVTHTFSLKLGQSVSDRFHTLTQRREVDATNLAPGVCALSRRGRLASVIGLSGCFSIPDSLSSTPFTKRWPCTTVRPFCGRAGQWTITGVRRSFINASLTGPILPVGVESNVEQYLK